MSKEFEIALTEPITVIDTPLSKLVFAMPTGRHLIGLPNPELDPTGWALLLASKCVKNAPADVVLDLPASEAIRIAGEVAARVPPPQRASSSTDTSSAPAPGVTSPSSI